MVVTRRKLSRTSGASPSVGRSHRGQRGLSFPCVPRPPLARHHWGALRVSIQLYRRLENWPGAFALDGDADGPHAAEQLPCHPRHDLLFALAAAPAVGQKRVVGVDDRCRDRERSGTVRDRRAASIWRQQRAGRGRRAAGAAPPIAIREGSIPADRRAPPSPTACNKRVITVLDRRR